MSLLNKHVFVTDGCFWEGIIIKHETSPVEYFMVQPDGGGQPRAVTKYSIHHTKDSAKSACEDNVQYWQGRANDL